MKHVAIIGIFSFLAASPAIAGEPIGFRKDGIRYAGQIERSGDLRHIVGREEGSGRTFDLYIRGSTVTGTYDGQPVSFVATKVTTLAGR